MVLSDSQAAVREEVRAFAQQKIRPRTAEFEANGGFPAELLRELGEQGLMGLLAPKSLGGRAVDAVSYALALMEIAAADGALSTVISIQNSIVISGILGEGTDAQKARFLPGLVSGEVIGAFALTEPEAGSDAAAIRTRAERAGQGWKINGAKQFITSARIAGLVMLIGVTDLAAGKRGLSAFLAPAPRGGLRVGAPDRKLGQAASDTCALQFEDMLLEADLLLGQEGEGYRIALSSLETGRIGIGAQAVGMAQAALDIAVSYAKTRRTMGKPILEHQAVGFRLADLAAKLEAARQLVLHAASRRDAKLPCVREASMAKLVASETAEAVISAAIQTLGGNGYLEDFGVAKIYRDARACQIYEGTSDILRLVIARGL